MQLKDNPQNESFLLLCFRSLVGAIWSLSGVLHITNLTAFATAIGEYGLLPRESWMAASVTLSLAELLLGSLLILRTAVPFAFGASSFLYLLFLVAVAKVLWQGQTVSCGCFGSYSGEVTVTHGVLLFVGLVSTLLVCLFGYRSAVHQRYRPMTLHGIKPSGFSLVELLCVLSLIGILLALLIPAVQQAREAGRSVTCQNRLRQLILATQNFESGHRRFPAGTIGIGSDLEVRISDFPGWQADPSSPFYLHNHQNTSWIVQILPYVEQAGLFNSIPAIASSNRETYRQYQQRTPSASLRLVDDPEVQVAIGKRFPLLYCPSDTLDTANNEGYKCGSQPAYLVDAKQSLFIYFESVLPMAGTNYAACSGADSGGYHHDHVRRRFDGAFGSRSVKRPADVLDGLSQSIGLGETLGTIVNRDRTEIPVWFFGRLCRGRSDLEWLSNQTFRNVGLELFGDDWFAHMSGFGSKHATGANFAYLDGSIHSIAREIDLQAFYNLCGIADQNVVGTD